MILVVCGRDLAKTRLRRVVKIAGLPKECSCINYWGIQANFNVMPEQTEIFESSVIANQAVMNDRNNGIMKQLLETEQAKLTLEVMRYHVIHPISRYP
jgi:hypothetical protein